MIAPDQPLKNPCIGSPNCGLAGPFLFPAVWRYVRSVERCSSARKKVHKKLPDLKGVPLFVEAAPLPIKQLRGLLVELAKRIDEHASLDLGEAFFNLFATTGRDAVIPLHDATWLRSVSRYGSRLLFHSLASWFYTRWGELQARALDNGRFFPPPLRLQARVNRDGSVRMEAGFAHGFVPADRLVVLHFTRRQVLNLRCKTWFGLLSASEPIPIGRDGNDQLLYYASQFAQPGERITAVGTLFDQSTSPDIYARIREGDELTFSRGDYGTLYLHWNGIRLGRMNIRDQCYPDTSQPIAAGVLRIIRLGAFYGFTSGRIAIGLFIKT
jgi:hypothetical protein